MILEKNWGMWIPGFGTDEIRPYKRTAVTEAHRQRLALIRKHTRKYWKTARKYYNSYAWFLRQNKSTKHSWD